MADDRTRYIGLARPAGHAFLREDPEDLSFFPEEVLLALQKLRKQNREVPTFLSRAEDILRVSGELPPTLESKRPRRLRPSRREEVFWRVASLVSLGESKKKAIESAADYYEIEVDTAKREFTRQLKKIRSGEEVFELIEIEEDGSTSVFVCSGCIDE